MTHHHRSPDPSLSSTSAAIVPPILLTLMAAFREFFTAPVWDHVLVLVTGAVLTTGKRTVCAVLRVMGLSQSGDFALYHHVLSQARWDSRAIARQLLVMILERFLPNGPVIIGIDDTIERRWGKKIAARGIYRDPVRSSHGHFVKASGLRWLSFMAMVPLPFSHRRWALPFLTILAPSQRHDDTKGKRHKSLADWARQGILQIKCWLPNRLIVVVADSTFAAIELSPPCAAMSALSPACGSTPICSNRRPRAEQGAAGLPRRAASYQSSPRFSPTQLRCGPRS